MLTDLSPPLGEVHKSRHGQGCRSESALRGFPTVCTRAGAGAAGGGLGHSCPRARVPCTARSGANTPPEPCLAGAASGNHSRALPCVLSALRRVAVKRGTCPVPLPCPLQQRNASSISPQRRAHLAIIAGQGLIMLSRSPQGPLALAQSAWHCSGWAGGRPARANRRLPVPQASGGVL